MILNLSSAMGEFINARLVDISFSFLMTFRIPYFDICGIPKLVKDLYFLFLCVHIQFIQYNSWQSLHCLFFETSFILR